MKAVFLDRDGVINELVYHQEQGVIDSPFSVEQFRLLSGVGRGINEFHEMGYKVIVVSNQPGIAKGHLSWETFGQIREKMRQDLDREGAFVDREYYCFHHPEARIENLRSDCDCRKPKPGMLLQAVKDMDIDLSWSWLIGDNLTDIKAGKEAGCRAILLGRMKCEFCRLMDEDGARPDIICANLLEAVERISLSLQMVKD
jgi:histidinol-phosphate phosphatase family protein